MVLMRKLGLVADEAGQGDVCHPEGRLGQEEAGGVDQDARDDRG